MEPIPPTSQASPIEPAVTPPPPPVGNPPAPVTPPPAPTMPPTDPIPAPTPPPTTPHKKSKAGLIILLIIAVLVGFSTIGAVVVVKTKPTPTPMPTQPPTPIQSPAPTQPAPKQIIFTSEADLYTNIKSALRSIF